MPLQNTGTLLENLVLVESARLLFDETQGIVDIASAFSMPPLTVWRRAEKYSYDSPLFTIAQLNAVANGYATEPESYRELLRQCLAYDRMRGPNGVLLVGLLALQRERTLRAWVEDVSGAAAHYGPTRPVLEALGTYASAIGKTNHSPFGRLTVTTTPYPDCIDELRNTLSGWMQRAPAQARLGYLDPNVYHPEGREGLQTARRDHQQWLRSLTRGAPTWSASVHFSSNRSTEALVQGLKQMHADARAAGYHATRSYRHQSHTITVCVQGPSLDAAAQYMNGLDKAVQAGWMQWVDALGNGSDAPPEAVPLERYDFSK